MKFIDMKNYNRKDHYNFFKEMDYPRFNICANLDITKFYQYIKENELPFFISVLYAATKAANDVRELKFRIREDEVIEHEIVNPSFTVITDEEVFSFCEGRYIEKFNEFKDYSLKQIEKVKNNVTIEDEPGQDNLLYITSIPWISFTSVNHPIHMNPVDSVPRIAWGKYFEENDKIKLPFSIDVHHALVDGVHIGKYFKIIQEIFDNPNIYIEVL